MTDRKLIICHSSTPNASSFPIEKMDQSIIYSHRESVIPWLLSVHPVMFRRLCSVIAMPKKHASDKDFKCLCDIA